MNSTSMAGRVQTVLGPMDPEDLGVTLCGDQLLMDLSNFRGPPVEASARDQFFSPISQETLANMRYYGMRNFELLRLGNVSDAIEEAMLYKQWGGVSVINGASVGLGRDPVGTARVARATGLNVIMGGSYYAVRSHPPGLAGRSEDDIVEELVRDVTEGIDGTGIKVGIMGETGLTSPTADSEIKVLRATGRAQRITGVPLLIHPGESNEAPLQHLELMAGMGVDLGRVMMAHVSTRTDDVVRQIARAGCYLRYEFGGEGRAASPYTLTYRGTNEDPGRVLRGGAPGNGEQILKIQQFISEGFGDKIVLTSDMNTRNRLFKYGGHGYFFILANIVPRMRASGFSEETIHQILVENPGNALTFGSPRSE